MKIFKSILLLLVAVVAMVLPACGEKETVQKEPPRPAPKVEIKVKELSRTEVTFTIKSIGASDYVYLLAKAGDAPADAETFFKNGKIGYLEDGTATITSKDLEGSQEYVLYAATRAINPYTYSEIAKIDLSTSLPYTSTITMERIGQTDFSYHIEMPKGVTKLKQMAVKKNDFEAVRAMLQAYGTVTLATYLKVFGHEITQSGTFTLDKLGKTGQGDDINVHPELEYYILAGEPDADGNIAEDKLQQTLFTTKAFPRSPFTVHQQITSTSTTLTVDLRPDPEIVSYRAHIASRADYEYILREGTPQWKASVVGYWDDKLNIEKGGARHEYTGESQLRMAGLHPETEYVVGVIGYDRDGRECFINEYCITTPPVGPLPEVTISPETPLSNCPWNSKAYRVKVKNTQTLHVGFFPKAALDRKLSEGYSLEELVRNNADPVDAESLADARGEGAIFEINTLTANAPYYFAAYAENDEFVGVAKSEAFTTERQPSYGGETRANMPGRYTAKTTDGFGRTVSFDVTIATGVNDATTAAYDAANRLVCLGFGPANKYPVQMPEQLVAAGKTPSEANLLYGPKWFIEFSENSIFVPTVRDENTRGFSWAMYESGGKPVYFMGFGTRSSGDVIDSSAYQWPVTVSEDGSTITLGGIDSTFGYDFFPGMGKTDSWYSASLVYRCYSALTLTRKPDAAPLRLRPLSVPTKFTILPGIDTNAAARRATANRLSK